MAVVAPRLQPQARARRPSSSNGSSLVEIYELPQHRSNGLFADSDDDYLQVSSSYGTSELASIHPSDVLSLASNQALSIEDRSTCDRTDRWTRSPILHSPSLPGSASRTRLNLRSPDRLTESALSNLPQSRNTEHDRVATHPTIDEETLADSTELHLSLAPNAISAGIRPIRRHQQPFIDRSRGLKRRHRQSGVSDKGSKRSNTSSSAARALSEVNINVEPPKSPVLRRLSIASEQKPIIQRGRQALMRILQVDRETQDLIDKARRTSSTSFDDSMTHFHRRMQVESREYPSTFYRATQHVFEDVDMDASTSLLLDRPAARRRRSQTAHSNMDGSVDALRRSRTDPDQAAGPTLLSQGISQGLQMAIGYWRDVLRALTNV